MGTSGLCSDDFVESSDVGEFQPPSFSGQGQLPSEIRGCAWEISFLCWISAPSRNGLCWMEWNRQLHLLHLFLCSFSGVFSLITRDWIWFWDTHSITMSHVFSCEQDFPILNQLWSYGKSPGWLTESWPEASIQVSKGCWVRKLLPGTNATLKHMPHF